MKTFLAMARQKPAKLERTDIGTVIETALDVSAYGLRSSGARVEPALEATPPISADADQLAQVFANLVVNAEHALKDRAPDGQLRIKTKTVRGGREVRVVVRDNGPGIPPAIRVRIFEPLFTTKGVGEGTGVGLAYCRRIVEAHGGRITVGVAPQGGAQFSMHFPTIAAMPTDEAAKVAPTAPAWGRALVVDDEADVAKLFAIVLSAAGFEVETAASAEDAIRRPPGDYRLILCDLNMPGRGGRGFFDAIQSQWPELENRLGFVTGDTMSGGVEAFLRASGRPYLEKPATPADIRRLASALAEPQRAGAAR